MMDLAEKQLKREKPAYCQQSFEKEASKLTLGTGHLKVPLTQNVCGKLSPDITNICFCHLQ